MSITAGGHHWRFGGKKEEEKKRRGDPKEDGKETERLAGTHWGLSRGHSGSAGSSSPIEEGKQILITSSTSHTKGPRNARAGGLAGRTTQAWTTNETPPLLGPFPRTSACERSFHSAQFLSYVDAQVTATVGANDPRNRLKCLGGAASFLGAASRSGER